MTVRQLALPGFTVDDAATYKAHIDDSIAALAQHGNQFAPHQMAPAGLGITVEAGLLFDGVLIAAANVTGIGAPAAHPRIDRIYLDLNTHAYVRVVGVEGAVPAVPALPLGKYPIAQILLNVGDTQILNANIIDERPGVMVPVGYLRGDGYSTFVDPDGLIRVLFGRGGSDNRIILRLHTSDTGSKVQFQDSGGNTIAELDGDGNFVIAGVLTQSHVF